MTRLFLDRGADATKDQPGGGSAPLLNAITNAQKAPAGRVALVELLTERGAVVDGPCLRAALEKAAENERAEDLARAVVARKPDGVDGNAVAWQAGSTIWVPFFTRASFTALCLDAGLDVNRMRNGQTALHAAAEQGHADVARLLLERGADAERLSDYSVGRGLSRSAALFHACHCGKEDVVRHLLELRPDLDVNASNQQEVSPCYTACQRGHASCARLVLERGADVHKVKQPNHPEDGTAPLYAASEKGNLDAVNVLLEFKADPNHKANDGWTALFIAAKDGHLATCVRLLDGGAGIDDATNRSATPVFAAAQEGRTDCTTLLLDRGADASICMSNTGASPLHIASEHRHVDSARVLLDRGADPNLRRKDGLTPLYLAAEKCGQRGAASGFVLPYGSGSSDRRTRSEATPYEKHAGERREATPGERREAAPERERREAAPERERREAAPERETRRRTRRGDPAGTARAKGTGTPRTWWSFC